MDKFDKYDRVILKEDELRKIIDWCWGGEGKEPTMGSFSNISVMKNVVIEVLRKDPPRVRYIVYETKHEYCFEEWVEQNHGDKPHRIMKFSYNTKVWVRPHVKGDPEAVEPAIYKGGVV